MIELTIDLRRANACINMYFGGSCSHIAMLV